VAVLYLVLPHWAGAEIPSSSAADVSHGLEDLEDYKLLYQTKFDDRPTS
jgi:hypothetical protein